MRCSSHCLAMELDTTNLVKYLNDNGLEPQYFDDVVYIQKATADKAGHYIDIFFFPFGCITIWGADELTEKGICSSIKAFHRQSYHNASSDFIYFDYEKNVDKAFIDEENNRIILGDNTVFTKLSISHALAQSVKLEILENTVNKLLKETNPIRKELANSGSVSLSKKEISKQIGVLFNERYLVNLHSDVLDTPEFFWRRPSYEPIYLKTAKFQDIQIRQDILYRRMDMIHELYTILSSELDHKHSTRLEIIIIMLIALEVILALLHDNLFQEIWQWLFSLL